MTKSTHSVSATILGGATLLLFRLGRLSYFLGLYLYITWLYGNALFTWLIVALAVATICAVAIEWRRRSVPINPRTIGVCLVALAPALSLFIQRGPAAAAISILLLVVLAAAVETFPLQIPRQPWIYLIAGAGILTTLWLRVVGARNMIVDLAIATLTFAIVVAFRLHSWRRATSDFNRQRANEFMLVTLLTYSVLAWILSTLVDRLDVYRLLQQKPSSAANSLLRPEPGAVRISLALSGGGYRAALLHAGVLYQLEKAGIRVNVVSSISGGSIAAAAEMSNVTPAEFVTLVSGGAMNLRRELANLDRVFEFVASVRIPFTDSTVIPGAVFSRIDAQASVVDRAITLGRVLHDYPMGLNTTAWIIGTTDILERAQVGITSAGVIVVPIRPPAQRLGEDSTTTRLGRSSFGPAGYDRCSLHRIRPTREITASEAVAASGAFPGAFNTLDVYEYCDGTVYSQRLLADGGVIDNYGVVLLEAAADLAAQYPRDTSLQRLASDVIVVSDGSEIEIGQAMRDVESDRARHGALDQLSNVVNTMYSLSSNRYDGGDILPKQLVFMSARNLVIPEEGGSVDDRKFMDAFDRLSEGDRYALAEVMMGSNPSLARNLTAAWLECISPKGPFSFLWPKSGSNEWDLMEKQRQIGHCVSNGRSLDSEGPIPMDFERMTSAYLGLSTLDDRISREQADSVFALGRAVVILSLPKLRAAISVVEGERITEKAVMTNGKTLDSRMRPIP